jgi:cell division protease FtsH
MEKTMHKINNLILNSVFALAIFSSGMVSIAYAEGKTNSAVIPGTLEEQIQDELEQLLKQTLSQLTSIDFILQELGLLVGNNQVAQGDNKKEIMESIHALHDLIDKIRSDTFVTIDLQSIYLMLKLNNALMNHLGQALLKGFHALPPFDLEKNITKHLQTEVGLENISQTLIANNLKLEELTKMARNAGLHWYNHAYRSLNDHVLQPAQKYKAGTILSLSAAAGALLWWYTDSEHLAWLRNYTGWHPKVDKFGTLDEKYHETHPLNVIGGFEKWCIHYTQGLMPYATFALPLFVMSCKNELELAHLWLKKKIKAGVNHLKGGIHEKEYEGITKKNPDIDFSNVIGNEKAKIEGWKVVKYMEDPERYDRFSMGVERGILLIGKTRTGKTYFAEALAGEIKKVIKQQNRNSAELGFYNIKASLIVKHGIEYILNMAKKEAPCVLFIDEIDLLALQRVGGDKDMLYNFLTSMSGCFEHDLDKRVIIIGATNNPQNLDKALKARGRFGMILEFTYPELRERRLYLEKHLNALTLNPKAFDLEKLARETEGCSYEALLAIIREAFLQAKIKGAPINQALLEQALDTSVRNIIFENQKELPAYEQHIIAAHMAGHSFVSLLLPTNKKLAKVTTLPVLSEIEEEPIWETYSKKDKEDAGQKDERITQYGQIFTYHDKDSISLSDETERLRLCTFEVAGHVAEKLLLGSCGYSYHADDTQKALNHVKAVVFKGIKEADLSEAEADKRKDDALTLLKKCEADALRLLQQNKPALQRLATALEQKKILSAEQIMAIIAGDATAGQKTTVRPENSHPDTTVKPKDTASAKENHAAALSDQEIDEQLQKLGAPEIARV